MKRLVLCALVAACSSGPGNPPDDTLDRGPLLSNLGTNVIGQRAQAFVAQARALAQAASSWADEPEDAAARDAARDAWRAAMTEWQHSDVMQVGPAAPASDSPGGRALRDEIYSWPTANPCRVDQEMVARGFANEGFFDQALVNAYGLDALEYLLFREDFDNACPPQAVINQNGSWAELDDDEITRRRAAYAKAASAFLVKKAEELADAWDPEKGDFATLLSNAGRSGSAWSSQQDAVDEIYAAMFYADMELKDMKLADPTGISGRCATDACPELFESRWAKHSKENVIANLQGLRELITGGAPGEEDRAGFDDLLVAVGAPQLATQLVADVDAAIAQAQAVEGPFEDADLDEVRAVHAAVKKITDELKSRFVTLLNLRVPNEGAADND